MRISDWSSDVCSSDLICPGAHVDLSGTLCHLTRNPPNQDWLYFMPDDAMKDEIESRSLIEMTTSVVAAYLSNNHVASGQIAEVIHTLHGAHNVLTGDGAAPAPEPLPPAVQIRKPVNPASIICLHDG